MLFHNRRHMGGKFFPYHQAGVDHTASEKKPLPKPWVLNAFPVVKNSEFLVQFGL